MKNTEPIPKEVRLAVLIRSGGFCERCGKPKPLEMHHIVSRLKGGENTEENLRALCRPCHICEDEDRGRPLKEAGEKFVVLPLRVHPDTKARLWATVPEGERMTFARQALEQALFAEEVRQRAYALVVRGEVG